MVEFVSLDTFKLAVSVTAGKPQDPPGLKTNPSSKVRDIYVLKVDLTEQLTIKHS